MSVENGCNNLTDCQTKNDIGETIYKLCYQDVAWSDLSSFCDCSSWYGFSGPSCDIPTVQSRFFQVVLVLYTCWSSLFILILSAELTRYLYKSNNATKLSRKDFGPAFVAACFCLLGFLFLLTYSLINLRALVDPRRFTIESFSFIDGSLEDVTVENGRIAVASLVLSLTCVGMTVVYISLTWIDVAQGVWKFFEPTFQRRIKRFKQFVKYCTITYFVSIVVLAATGFYNGIAIMIILMIIVYILLIVIGRISFVAAISRISKEDREKNQLPKTIRTVRHSSLFHILFLSICVFATLLFFAISPNYTQYIEVGEFNSVLAIRDIGTLSSVFIFSVNTFYTRDLLRKIGHNKRVSVRQLRAIRA